MDSIVILTGAGVSAESGLGTFRDVGGLWDQYDLEEVATPQGFAAQAPPPPQSSNAAIYVVLALVGGFLLLGVLAGLMITGMPFGIIMTGVGIISLAGVVVNNAIVLIDYTRQLRAEGLPVREALQRAGEVRLRPILMTTLTTVLGLMPMALSWGEGAELRAPLAITVASGLVLSTLLTLVVIPAAYQFVPSTVSSSPVASKSPSIGA